MTNAHSLFRSLIIYAIVLPLAIFIGYLLSDPLDSTTVITIGLLAALLVTPLLLKFHYAWLLFSWNSIMGLYFLPGKPSMGLLMCVASFGIALLSYIMNRNLKFISVPSVSWPIFAIAAVVAATAKLTGGIGLNVLGADSIGGKRYIYLFGAILGYFAIISQRIPEKKGDQYIKLFFLGGLTAIIGQVASWIGTSVSFVFLIFPPDSTFFAAPSGTGPTILRLGGLANASIALYSFLLARYGLSGVLNTRKHWRTFFFLACCVACLFGGFRSMLIALVLTCAVLFYMEGLTSSKLMPAFLLIGILLVTTAIPFVNKLPLNVQRSLAFLPLNIDQDVVESAAASTEWRVEMWKDVLPTVPQYLILGKGYTMNYEDFDMVTHGMTRGQIGAAGSELAGDYHNGPLSLIIPFGLFGVAAFIWFLVAGFRVLLMNYRYGNPAYANTNRFFLVFFGVKIFMFFVIFGSFHSDLYMFLGPVGLSIALHGGVCKPAVEPAERPVLKRFRLAGATR